MLNERESLGIALIVLYAPVLPSALYLFTRRHGHPGSGWYFMATFSIFRIISGGMLIALPSNQDNLGVIITAIIALNVGVIPLMLTTLGFIRIVRTLDFAKNNMLHNATTAARMALVAGAVLIGVGGGIASSSDTASTGHALAQAGYVVLAVMLAVFAGLTGFLWTRRSQLGRTSSLCLYATTAAIVLLIVRIAYAMLEVFHPYDLEWNPLYGSVGAFAGMVVVMEWLIVVMYIAVGFSVPPIGKKKV